MELVAARSLDQIIAHDGPLPPDRAADAGRQLLAALATAHAAGVLHRDVKPSNVLLADGGRAVLTDFGIATFQGDPKLTQTGMVMGSPGFTAPERIQGNPATPASDLWSLGATLYAAVEGHGPFDRAGGAITTMSAIINSDRRPLRPPPGSARSSTPCCGATRRTGRMPRPRRGCSAPWDRWRAPPGTGTSSCLPARVASRAVRPRRDRPRPAARAPERRRSRRRACPARADVGGPAGAGRPDHPGAPPLVPPRGRSGDQPASTRNG